jgi:hypothetical protein
MTSQILNNVKSVTSTRWNRFGTAARRVGHGGTAWSTETNLIQPQDGAIDDGAAVRSRVTDISTRLQVAAFGAAALVEPEDAWMTGGTRSLMRRLIGLNVRPTAKPVAQARVRSVRKTEQAQVA